MKRSIVYVIEKDRVYDESILEMSKGKETRKEEGRLACL